ncbi:MAG: hypothetical protein L3J86_06545 [Thermoplasmata archaeon]|nr:hypothetical protein [Thermoplasmata archaeon]
MPAAAAPVPTAPGAPKVPESPAPLTGDVQDLGMARRDSVRGRSWTARGGAKVLGDVEVETADLQGVIAVRGRLSAARLQVQGTLDITGATTARESIAVDGTARFGGPVSTGTFRISGTGKLSASLKVGGAAHWKGMLEVVGDVEAATVEFDGRITAAGRFAAPTITGRLRHASKVASIQATRLTLTRPGLLPPLQNGSLEVLRIDAREATLEGVTAEFAKVEQLTVGPHCHIAQVEGHVLSVHPTSHVGPESRSPKPHGLSR